MRPFAAIACGAPVWILAGSALADEADGDALTYRAHVDTSARLFRRGLVSGPGGAVTSSGVAAPLYHHAGLRVFDIDAPWLVDSIDAELSAWGNLEIGDADGAQRVDGDVHIAKVRQRFERGYIALGRQVRAGGAARYAHFDGIEAGFEAPEARLGISAYGGLSVLPRWSEPEGYHLLGSAADDLVRDPAIVPSPSREEHWMAGGRLFAYEPGLLAAGFSFHEEREAGELGRRNAALDADLTPTDEIAFGGLAVLEMDSAELSDLRAHVDAYPADWTSLSVSYHHLSPALLLSRQSVLSVFSTEAFDEWGTLAEFRPVRWFRVDAEGFAQRFDDGEPGARFGGSFRATDTSRFSPSAGMGYRRVSETDNGYHSVRATTGVSPATDIRLTGDGYLYLYDEPIQAISSSIVGVFTTTWQAHARVQLALSGSAARSPYAAIDAQALARVSVDIEGGAR